MPQHVFRNARRPKCHDWYDRICDLDFESGVSTSEITEEQLTDGMDTDNFCDGQGAKCKTKRVRTFLHTNRARSGTNCCQWRESLTKAGENKAVTKIQTTKPQAPQTFLKQIYEFAMHVALIANISINSYRFLFYGHAMFNQRWKFPWAV